MAHVRVFPEPYITSRVCKWYNQPARFDERIRRRSLRGDRLEPFPRGRFVHCEYLAAYQSAFLTVLCAMRLPTAESRYAFLRWRYVRVVHIVFRQLLSTSYVAPSLPKCALPVPAGSIRVPGWTEEQGVYEAQSALVLLVRPRRFSESLAYSRGFQLGDTRPRHYAGNRYLSLSCRYLSDCVQQ